MKPENAQVERSWALQKRFHGLADEDRRLLERFRPHFEIHAAAIIEDLIQHLKNAQLLVPEAFERPRIDSIKTSLLGRLRAAATGAGGLEDFEAAQQQAVLLEEAGLPPHYFVACHTRALDRLAAASASDWSGTPQELSRYLAAFARALMVNAAAGSEAYSRIASGRFARGYQETLDIRVGLEELHTMVRELATELSVPGILTKVGISARRLSRADASFLWIVPEGSSTLVPMVAEGLTEEALEPIHYHVGVGFVGMAASEGRLMEGDLSADERIISKEFFRRQGLRQGMAMPILSKGSVKGVLGVARRDLKPYSEMEKKLLTSLASFSGVSLELAQLYSQTLTTQRSLERLHEIARDLSVELELVSLLRKIIDGASELARSEAVMLWTLSDDGQQMIPSVWTGLPDEAGGWSDHAGDEGMGEVLRSLSPVEIDLGAYVSGTIRERFGRAGLRSSLCLPILHLGRPVSVLLLARRHLETYTPNEREVISTLASFAASAIERAKLVQEAVRARIQWEATFESIQDFVLVVDPTERIVRANQSFLRRLGYSAEDVIGRPWYEIIGYEQPEPRSYVDLKLHGRPVGGEVQPPRLIGTFQLDANLTRTIDGKVTGTVLVLRDITEKKRFEQQLIQAEKISAIGQLVSGVAHELNNPMSSVIGFAELADKTAGLPEEAKGYLTIVRDEAQRAVKIVKNLLTFARQHKPERTKAHLHDVVQRVGALLAYDLRSHHIKLVQDLAPDFPWLMIDPHQMQQVLLNLVNNAMHALQDLNTRDGVITIRTRLVDAKVRVSVIDNGPGIKPDILPKIFDPFFTTKPVGKGTGLGLSVCYGIVKEHGGAMWAESEFGRGASFNVDLPLTALDAAQAPAPAETAAKPRKLRILVVDDEPSILKFVTKILSDGNTVVTADDGREAIQALNKETFDLIISDIRMPEVGGKELYEFLQREKPEMLKRVMFTTGDILSEETSSFIRKTSVPILEKPFSSKDLMTALLALTQPS